MILRRKLFSDKKKSRRERIAEFDAETDRIAEKLNQEAKKKKLSDDDKAFGVYMYNTGGEAANRAKWRDEEKRRALPGIVGGAVGYMSGKKLATKYNKKHPTLIGIGAGLVADKVAGDIAQKIGQKKSDEVLFRKMRANEKDVVDYIRMPKKEKEEFKKRYDPVKYQYVDSQFDDALGPWENMPKSVKKYRDSDKAKETKKKKKS